MDENDLSSLQLVAFSASAQLTQYLRLKNSLTQFTTTDTRAIRADIRSAHTARIVIPVVDPENVKSIGYGAVEPTGYDYSYVDVRLEEHLDVTKPIGDFMQSTSDYDLMKLAMTMGEEMLRKINNIVAREIFYPGKFTHHAVIEGAGANLFKRVDFTNAWINLTSIGVNVEDMFFLTGNAAYQNTLQAEEFANADVVGDRVSETARSGVFINTLGIPVSWDHKIGLYEAGKYAGYMGTRAAAVTLFREPMLPPPGTGVVATSTPLGVSSIPAQFRIWYDPNAKAQMVGLSVLMGYKVCRQEFMQELKTA